MRARTAEALQRRRDDQDALVRGRALAIQLAEISPGWVLHYGPASRRLWAYAAWKGAPSRPPLCATDPRALQQAMRDVERDHARQLAPPPWPVPPMPVAVR